MTRGPWRWRVGPVSAERAALDAGAPGALVVRPERIRIVGSGSEIPAGANSVEAAITDVLYLGSDRKYGLTLPDGQRAVVRQQRDGAGGREWPSSERVQLTWSVDDGVLVADPTG